MSKQIIVKLNNSRYIWTGADWYDADTFLQPSKTIIRELNHQLERLLEEEDRKLTDISEILSRATKARDAQQYQRSEQLARQALILLPSSHAAAAVLCATLRACGRSKQAIKETEKFLPTRFPALLTSRAAALCDLNQWKQAKVEVGRALAIQPSQEAFNVVSRIKKAAPDLYK